MTNRENTINDWMVRTKGKVKMCGIVLCAGAVCVQLADVIFVTKVRESCYTNRSS